MSSSSETDAAPAKVEMKPLGEEDEEQQQSQEAPIQYNPGINMPVTGKKKKKRKGKTAAARGPTAMSKNRGNGFEEYFADPPITPNEAMEEKNEIYSPDLSFEERIQSCIQRFRARRRLQGDRTLFFNEYLFLGGVDTNPSSYQGLGRDDLKDLTPAQRREATATDIVYGTTSAGDRFYNGDKQAWTVDFAGVAAGFFSTSLVNLTSFEWMRMEQGIDTVENFLKYVLHHDVCPEHEADLKAALVVCEVARVEWPMLQRLYASLPGQFNLAAAELFCPEPPDKNWSFQLWNRPDNFDAKSVFYSAFALMEEPELFGKIRDQVPKVVREFSCTLELVDMTRPTDDVIKRVKALVIDDTTANLVPVGKATLKPATIEDEWDKPEFPCPIQGDTITLWFDDVLLENMEPGMKTTVTVCELDVGLNFVKTVQIIVPSFYTYLPQQLMRHYKTPRENDRPAPSIHDPEAEEKQFAAAAKEG
ncbi:Fc.00g080560.m01.CDS01 [Cosmosporella sp. VM-42]